FCSDRFATILAENSLSRQGASTIFVDVLLFSFQGSGFHFVNAALIGDFINISYFRNVVNTISKYFFARLKDMYKYKPPRG
ncbi:hypothetical protein ACSFXN_16315, partial [Planococcus sp. 1R117A]|uniref:hypothetical protein n=1 Tax=Planococcus sp. 1R117A TaxID=3447020 RepID=UPI003EDCA257